MATYIQVRCNEWIDVRVDDQQLRDILDGTPIADLEKYLTERREKERRKEGEPTPTDNLYLSWWKKRWGADYPEKAFAEAAEAT